MVDDRVRKGSAHREDLSRADSELHNGEGKARKAGRGERTQGGGALLAEALSGKEGKEVPPQGKSRVSDTPGKGRVIL